MNPIKVSKITPNPASIASGASVTLNYNIDGDDTAPLTIKYSLDPANNIFFSLPDGTTSKTLPIDNTNLDNPPMAVAKTVKIVRLQPAPGGGNSTAFDITVFVKDTAGGTWDQNSCNILIP